MINWEKYLKVRDVQHELELALMEERLAEHMDLKGERAIKAEEDLYKALRGFRLKGVEKWGYKEPPKMRRVMLGATTDWDFSTTNWELDAVIYVSAPSSLRPTGPVALACKYAGTYPLDQGRIVTQARWAATYGPNYDFRWNSAPGGVSTAADRYRIREKHDGSAYSATRAVVGYYLGGEVWIAVRDYLANGAPPADTWDLRRFTWWVSAGVFLMRLERYYNAAWIKAINDVSDPNNRFIGNPDRRCGFEITTNRRLDDTEIWGP